MHRDTVNENHSKEYFIQLQSQKIRNKEILIAICVDIFIKLKIIKFEWFKTCFLWMFVYIIWYSGNLLQCTDYNIMYSVTTVKFNLNSVLSIDSFFLLFLACTQYLFIHYRITGPKGIQHDSMTTMKQQGTANSGGICVPTQFYQT